MESGLLVGAGDRQTSGSAAIRAAGQVHRLLIVSCRPVSPKRSASWGFSCWLLGSVHLGAWLRTAERVRRQSASGSSAGGDRGCRRSPPNRPRAPNARSASTMVSRTGSTKGHSCILAASAPGSLQQWLHNTTTEPDVVSCATRLRFAFYGRVSTPDRQESATSYRWQRHSAERTIAGTGTIVREYFDPGFSRSLDWHARPQARTLLRAVTRPDRDFGAIIIGEFDRASAAGSCYGWPRSSSGTTSRCGCRNSSAPTITATRCIGRSSCCWGTVLARRS